MRLRRTAKVRMLVGKSAGGFSGGTIASLMGAMFDETSEELKLAADPYALNPPNAHRYLRTLSERPPLQ